MNKVLWSSFAACVLITGGAVLAGVSAQDATQQPGQPTQARVWIQNRGSGEAVPVAIETTAQPLRVELSTAPMVTIGPETIVQARVARQAWEYREVRIPTGQGRAALLNGAGTDGWEATGIAFSDQGGTVVIMKRPL